MTGLTHFWDRCVSVGKTPGGRYLWRCPKESHDEIREFDALFPGLEVIESPHTFWILTEQRIKSPFQKMSATIDRIADRIVAEGSTKRGK